MYSKLSFKNYTCLWNALSNQYKIHPSVQNVSLLPLPVNTTPVGKQPLFWFQTQQINFACSTVKFLKIEIIQYNLHVELHFLSEMSTRYMLPVAYINHVFNLWISAVGGTEV